MVTPRVTPIRSNSVDHKATMKTSMNEVQTKPDEALLVEKDKDKSMEEVALSDDDAVPLGVAVNTRNYQTLMANLARRTSDSTPRGRRGHVGTVYHPKKLPLLPGSLTRNEKLVAAGQEKDRGEDLAVVGIPVDTRNYEAIVSGSRPIRSDPGTFNLLNRRATVSTMTQFVDGREEDGPPTRPEGEDNDDDDGCAEEDAVMGLPISTRNYVAYLAGEQGPGIQQTGHRHRGYSTLVSEKEVREPRVSDPYVLSSHRQKSPSDSCTSRKDTRPSCFDNRRASNAAVVPHAGWVFVQRGAFRSWKRYYAVLSGSEFKFSKGMGQSPKGFGFLVSVKRMKDLPCGLHLEFDDGSVLQIRCPSDFEYEHWLRAMEKTIERNQNFNSQSKTSYTLTASEQHEGYMFKQEKNKAWKRCFFVVRIEGYIECRDGEYGIPDRKYSGYIKAVSFADCHANGLAIQLCTDVSMVCYADSYDEQMLWYGALSAGASANERLAQPKMSVKSCYVQTAVTNYAGWLWKQAGLFKGWKRWYFTLHGAELGYAKDTNSKTVLCDKAHSVEVWEGHANGLLIRLMSGRVWKVHAETYETAKRWRSVISSACRHAETFNLKKYLNSRRRKKLTPVFGGWLTEMRKGLCLRRFFVVDGAMLGAANDVDNQLERLGTVVDVGSTRDLEHGMIFTLANGTQVKVNCDSLADSRCWYECLNFSLK
uniref:PH domain-containing protein n=1 Tax=Hyaloperonospora arabidopsidis (strain Emoy2) TaxID=559515 RepID=M4BDH2_HYAAE